MLPTSQAEIAKVAKKYINLILTKVRFLIYHTHVALFGYYEIYITGWCKKNF